VVDDPELELAEAFGAVARALLAEIDVQATLQRIVVLAVETIDNCEHAGILMVDGRSVTSPASSDEVPAVLDRIQSETGQGPCLDAIKEREVFQTGCLSREVRWPEFARRAVDESGIESVLSFRLFGDDTLGALNLYSAEADAFDDHDVAVGSVFAVHAAVAWSSSRTEQKLRAGMESRHLIGEAIGMLMGRQNISRAEAFVMLRQASQRLNVKLRVVAEGVVHPNSGLLGGKEPSVSAPRDDT
jgi:transcriptional regulator with GAF, ATPase, and Fis domain